MLGNMRCPPAIAKLLVAIFATIAEGSACTIIYPAFTTGPSFQVRVDDRGRPVQDLRIKLSGDNYTKIAKTGKDGVARFRNIPPGGYSIGTEFDGNGTDATITVTAAGPAETTVPLGWPSSAPLSVQTLKGIFRWPAVGTDQDLRTLQVEILDARTGRPLKSTRTTEAGAFNLETPRPGLYLLRVTPADGPMEGGTPIAGIVPVEVEQRAASRELELDFTVTSCGVWYAASHTCPRQELIVTGLSGQVLDPSGAAIPRAIVRVFNTDREIAEQLVSNEQGQFVSSKELEGRYVLVISAPGFSSLRQMVQINKPGHSDRPMTLRIELGIAGSCSLAAAPSIAIRD
jgi:hypothetical protein